MAETRLSDIDLYEGITPTVFKKVDSSDFTVTPFQIYKSWTVQSGSATSSCLPLTAIYSDPTILPALESELTFNDAKNIDDSLQTVTYFSVNHLFYKRKSTPYNTFGPTDLNRISKNLYLTASILSFPYVKIGEGIKPQSLQLTSSYSGINLDLRTDRYGNIYDNQISTSSIIPRVKFYEGFNEYFDSGRISLNASNTDTTKTFDRYVSGSVLFVPGIKATTGALGSIGYAAEFSGTGILVADQIPGYYDREHDYAISFFVSASSTGTEPQILIAKAGSRKPYNITVQPGKNIGFYMYGADPNSAAYTNPNTTLNVYISSSTAVSSSWNHVVCQKSGSYMQLYVNGVLESSVDQPLLKTYTSPFSQSMRIDSTGSTYIGGWNPISVNNYVGKLDEVRVYNKALTATEIGYLRDLSETGSMLQTNVVGNVFSKQGIAVISSPNYIYNTILQTPYTASYKSTVTRYEISTVVKLDSGDFNLSLNPTLTKDDNVSFQSFVSSSDFAPYITTIGLYDDYGQLLAIGKLAQPIRKRPDVDMNFLIRIDVDKNIT